MLFVVADLEDDCIHDEQCLSTDDYSMCGATGTCECQTGYAKTDDGCLEGNFFNQTTQHKTLSQIVSMFLNVFCTVYSILYAALVVFFNI